jgi:hypothetical protein
LGMAILNPLEETSLLLRVLVLFFQPQMTLLYWLQLALFTTGLGEKFLVGILKRFLILLSSQSNNVVLMEKLIGLDYLISLYQKKILKP